jgi:ribosomal protein L17
MAMVAYGYTRRKQGSGYCLSSIARARAVMAQQQEKNQNTVPIFGIHTTTPRAKALKAKLEQISTTPRPASDANAGRKARTATSTNRNAPSLIKNIFVENHVADPRRLIKVA